MAARSRDRQIVLLMFVYFFLGRERDLGEIPTEKLVGWSVGWFVFKGIFSIKKLYFVPFPKGRGRFIHKTLSCRRENARCFEFR